MLLSNLSAVVFLSQNDAYLSRTALRDMGYTTYSRQTKGRHELPTNDLHTFSRSLSSSSRAGIGSSRVKAQLLLPVIEAASQYDEMTLRAAQYRMAWSMLYEINNFIQAVHYGHVFTPYRPLLHSAQLKLPPIPSKWLDEMRVDRLLHTVEMELEPYIEAYKAGYYYPILYKADNWLNRTKGTGSPFTYYWPEWSRAKLEMYSRWATLLNESAPPQCQAVLAAVLVYESAHDFFSRKASRAFGLLLSAYLNFITAVLHMYQPNYEFPRAREALKYVLHILMEHLNATARNHGQPVPGNPLAVLEQAKAAQDIEKARRRYCQKARAAKRNAAIKASGLAYRAAKKVSHEAAQAAYIALGAVLHSKLADFELTEEERREIDIAFGIEH